MFAVGVERPSVWMSEVTPTRGRKRDWAEMHLMPLMSMKSLRRVLSALLSNRGAACSRGVGRRTADLTALLGLSQVGKGGSHIVVFLVHSVSSTLGQQYPKSLQVLNNLLWSLMKAWFVEGVSCHEAFQNL